MGNWFSNIDVEGLAIIEENVIDLSLNLDQEEIKTNSVFINQLIKALDAYDHFVAQEGLKGLSSDKINNIRELISHTKKQLLKFSPSSCSGSQDRFAFKKHISELEKQIQWNEGNDSWKEMMTLILEIAKLKEKKQLELSADEAASFAKLCLTVFIKCSATKTSTIFESNLSYLSSVQKNLKEFNTNNVTSNNKSKILNILLEHKSQIKMIYGLISDRIKELEGYSQATTDEEISSKMPPKAASTKPKDQGKHDQQLLQKVERDLDECHKITEKLHPPNGPNVVKKVREKVLHLIEVELKKTVNSNQRSILEKRDNLTAKGNCILKKLESIDSMNVTINESLSMLNKVQVKIDLMLESVITWSERQNILKSLWKEVECINVENKDVQMHKNAMIQRLTGLLITEMAEYLRNLKSVVQRYDLYAQQFSFSTQVKFYQLKVEEISSVKKKLDMVDIKFSYLEFRVQTIADNIDTVLKTLEIKANANQQFVERLEQLDILENEVNLVHTVSLETLRRCNEIRQEIYSFVSFNVKIIEKKINIIKKIQNIECHFYAEKFAEIMEIKYVMNHYEQQILQNLPAIFDKVCANFKSEIENIKHNRVLGKQQHFEKLLRNNLSFINKLLDETDKYHHDKQQILQHLRKKFQDLSKHPKNMTEIVNFEQELKSLNISIEEPDQFLQGITTLQSDLKEVKMKMINHRIQSFEQNVQNSTFPIKSKIFYENLHQLLILQDELDDLPEKDVHKQKIYIFFQNLDECLAKRFANTKKSENILQIQDRFKAFSFDETGVSKNSLEYVDAIFHHAHGFEDCIKYFVGVSRSVDYYVIEENLTRLLEKLDEVNGENDEVLLKKTVNIMEYIKNLIVILSSKVCA